MIKSLLLLMFLIAQSCSFEQGKNGVNENESYKYEYNSAYYRTLKYEYIKKPVWKPPILNYTQKINFDAKTINTINTGQINLIENQIQNQFSIPVNNSFKKNEFSFQYFKFKKINEGDCYSYDLGDVANQKWYKEDFNDSIEVCLIEMVNKCSTSSLNFKPCHSYMVSHIPDKYSPTFHDVSDFVAFVHFPSMLVVTKKYYPLKYRYDDEFNINFNFTKKKPIFQKELVSKISIFDNDLKLFINEMIP